MTRRCQQDDTHRVLIEAGGTNRDVAARELSAKLGNQIIRVSRDVVEAYHDIDTAKQRLHSAIQALERLVGRP